MAAELGIAGTSTNPVDYGPPNLNFTNFGALSDGQPMLTRNQSQGLTESVILSRGKHTLTLGAQYSRNDTSTSTQQNGRGTFNFNGLATSELDANGVRSREPVSISPIFCSACRNPPPFNTARQCTLPRMSGPVTPLTISK